MKIYSRTGDDGTTGLYGGERVAKSDPRVGAYGAVDEANAALGLARSLLGTERGPADSAAESAAVGRLDAVLGEIQNALFEVGADLATPLSSRQRSALVAIAPSDAAALEAIIDRYQETLDPLANFILPAGHPSASALHLARTVVRRAERLVAGLDPASVNPAVAVYLNRLSDLLFVLARAANSLHGRVDVPWSRRSPGPGSAG